ncbi:MAG: RluA family pseudouridine synthase [Oscillospiraceae bacterium]|nr:RluA family pseudouridine synthase [Oscillospiraceae bacterium]
MKSFTVGKNDAGQRLDKFLSKAAPGLPGSLLYKGIRRKNIKVGSKRATPGQKLEEGDIVSVYLPDDVLQPREHPDLEASAQLEIVYEDDNILLLNKPQGLLAHQGEGPDTDDTLIARVQRYLYQSGGWSPEVENSFAPALCHRIDRNTSGLVIAAKTAEALRVISEKLREREVTKLYICIVHGVPKNKAGLLKGYLCKDKSLGRVRVEQRPFPGGKTALTKYRVLAEQEGKSLVEAQLLTGRTHQIRAQFAAVGHPLWGDAKYGNSRENKLLGNKQALCAYKLIFSFATPAGPLGYLRGKAFEIAVPFAKDFGEQTL